MQTKDKSFWVAFSNEICKDHEDYGGTARYLTTGELANIDDGHEMIALQPDEHMLGVGGKSLLPSKHIRTFLHSVRNHPWYTRENTVLWTGYDEEADQSFVGLAIIVSKQLAEKARDKYLTTALAGQE